MNDIARPKNALVWFEIPSKNIEKAVTFYQTILQTVLDKRDMDGQTMYMFPYEGGDGVGGSLYPSEVINQGGCIVHLPVDDLEAGMERVTQAGGKITSDPIDIGDGRFAYFEDLDNNVLGLFAR